MIKLNIDQTSVSSVVNNLRIKEQEVLQAGRVGLHNAADIIFNKAQATIPFQTGALKASGKVTMHHSENSSEAIISYGDQTRNANTGKPTASYAVEKHEDPTGNKWLERTILNSTDIFNDVMQETIAKHL